MRVCRGRNELPRCSSRTFKPSAPRPCSPCGRRSTTQPAVHRQSGIRPRAHCLTGTITQVLAQLVGHHAFAGNTWNNTWMSTSTSPRSVPDTDASTNRNDSRNDCRNAKPNTIGPGKRTRAKATGTQQAISGKRQAALCLSHACPRARQRPPTCRHRPCQIPVTVTDTQRFLLHKPWTPSPCSFLMRQSKAA